MWTNDNVPGALTESFESWIGGSSPLEPHSWIAAIENEVKSKVQPLLFESESLELLTIRPSAKRCQWLPAVDADKRGARPVLSPGGIGLLRTVIARRVQAYYALAQPYKISAAVNMAALNRDDALRLELLMRRGTGAPYEVTWKTGHLGSLEPLGISWAQIPSNESRLKYLGVPLVLANGTRATGFESAIRPLITQALRTLSVDVNDGLLLEELKAT